jgi:hypothetical protein
MAPINPYLFIVHDSASKCSSSVLNQKPRSSPLQSAQFKSPLDLLKYGGRERFLLHN